MKTSRRNVRATVWSGGHEHEAHLAAGGRDLVLAG